MVDRRVIEHQLHHIGFNPFSWGRAEVGELCHIMMEGEELTECVNGEYSNGFALLASTNHRVLLVDKKPFLYLTVEDVRFEQISDFNFRNRFLTAEVTLSTSNKTLRFTSYNKKRLRHLISTVQQRVIDMRSRSTNSSNDWQRMQQLQAWQLAHMYGPASASASSGQPDAPAALPAATETAPTEATHNPPALSVENTASPKPEVAAPTSQPNPKPSPRTMLATYTRSKLPALRRAAQAIPASPALPVNNGEVYQRGYTPGSLPDYQL